MSRMRVIVLVMLLHGCAGSEPFGLATYVVRPEDTLYSIAWRHDVDYRELAKWNDLAADGRIAIGQVLVVAQPPAAAAASIPRAVSVPPHSPAREVPAPASRLARVPASGMAPPRTTANSKWVWPTNRVSPPRPVPGGGILLLGQLGQDVRAAGAGRVVYSGNGIRGYGSLIIIKHDSSLLSSYAHNRESLVREGQEVGAGQVIAHMGSAPHRITALYFEIRVNGKPADPLRYLDSPK